MEHLWPGSPVVFLLAWFGWRIAAKAGYSGFWGLTALFPPIGLIALWYLAMTPDWPRDAAPAVSSAPGDDPKDLTIRRPTVALGRSRS